MSALQDGKPDSVDAVQYGLKTVLSVCTGTFLLHKTGLLFGKMVTIHWNSLDRLRAIRDVIVVEKRFVRDGNIWTSAGVSAGIDLMFAFIADIAGEEFAGKVQLAAEYYPSARLYGASHESTMAPSHLKEKV
jgi:transcriptional regulator GlxA family with amidase domain